MEIRKSFAVVVFLVTLVFSAVRGYAQDEILINPPLTWSINSVQIVWTFEQDKIKTQESAFIYDAQQVNVKTADKENATQKRKSFGFSGGVGGNADVGIGAGTDSGTRNLFGKRINPLASFGLASVKTGASAYVEGGFNYNQTSDTTNTTLWSESEKNDVIQALTLAYDQKSYQRISNRRLVFTVDFVNHTKSSLFFAPNFANTIPVYCGNVHIGDAHLMINEIAYIAATGKPVHCQFAMDLNDTGKLSLINNRPIMHIEGGQLLIYSEEIEDAVKESTAVTSCFTVAILSGNDVKEWKIRRFRDYPVTLQDALEAINENLRDLSNDDNKTIFEMENDRLVSVCGVPFDKVDSDWLTQLKVFKGAISQIVSNPDSYLSDTPRRGERYVFRLVSRNIVNLETKAEAGDADAVFELAKRYDLGADVPKDKVKAMELLHKAAKLGCAEAQNSLGECYYNGVGVEKNKTEAVKWYRKAAEERRTEAQCSLEQRYKFGESVMPYLKANNQGLAAAQYNLGKLYYFGDGVKQDKSEAVKWYRKAAKQGHAQAQDTLAFCYNYGNGVKEDKSEAAKWYRKAAEQGVASSQYCLGNCCWKGLGVKCNTSEAMKWYRKAAEQGYLIAQLDLGLLYDSGCGVSRNYFEAAKWYRKAAEQGSVTGQNNLGKLYENGKGVKQSFEEAVKWYRKAAEQGYSQAQYNLGQCCQYGKGVNQDYKEAVKWYRKAAVQGYSQAQYNLGQCYYDGSGVKQDYKEAVKWYRKAAEQCHAEASYCLGWCYIYGRGVSVDLDEAENLFIRAKARGHKGAQRTLSVMGGVKVCTVAAAAAAAIIMLSSGN